ncbi:hypothetical protein DFH94DRAFT_770526 [Russula ochroleuca]|uniref:Probable RNA polymerase II nuclear localization protein SLC7A6OS n=1 Tax=Russula ochroleuca TaxID=152965 RepID=A0A9P5MMH7_9AGAM|nr:hypothetical protein DFH94DRAFT_770526 [Russula ochroleuca]
MEVDPTSPVSSQPYTILRIKRKRNEEPLDALVTESSLRRKKRGGLDVFQFAETVEPEAWGARAKDLQDRISALEREQALKVGTHQGHDDAPPPHLKRPDLSRQYTVVLDDKPATPSPASRPLSSVMSPVKDGGDNDHLEYKVYDAVLTSDAPSPVDPEMAKFLPLLEEYLTLHDMKPHLSRAAESTGSLTPSGSRSLAPIQIPIPAPIPPIDDPDYVWDVFYHRAGLPDYEAANVATLTGLPGPLADGYSPTSESEEEDEADEDSNAEEYYKNDYPDEESSDYDASEGSDDVIYDDSDG